MRLGWSDQGRQRGTKADYWIIEQGEQIELLIGEESRRTKVTKRTESGSQTNKKSEFWKDSFFHRKKKMSKVAQGDLFQP